ncbi:ABC transporter ATP-binding protein [Arthrobacter sp. NPDC055585]
MQLDVVGVSYMVPGRSDWLIKEQSLSFHPASLTAIMGPSGSGKSTFLNVIGQLTKPASGRVLKRSVEDTRVTHAIPYDFSWILQSNAVLAGRTAEDNVIVGLLAEGHTHKSAKVAARDTMEKLGLSSVARVSVALLSGGEIQRVTAARCLLSSSPVILADEPTGQLDRRSSLAVVEALRVAGNTGKIVIIATHDNAVAELCDTVFDLTEGTLRLRESSIA